jgi:threonine/homoserine/homoserine lactone efflux protein
VTIAANPKAAVFAFTFFPQFLPRNGPVLGAAATLGAIQVVVIDGPLRHDRAACIPCE